MLMLPPAPRSSSANSLEYCKDSHCANSRPHLTAKRFRNKKDAMRKSVDNAKHVKFSGNKMKEGSSGAISMVIADREEVGAESQEETFASAFSDVSFKSETSYEHSSDSNIENKDSMDADPYTMCSSTIV
ncbi:hypothetical protein BGZ76_010992 [Entomortierella beljakovae]|nr:hypothetical protein BGZ76_010992 [Entomortierella beljakovae]